MIQAILPLSRVGLTISADIFSFAMALAWPELACINTAVYELEGPLTILFVVKELTLVVCQGFLEDVPAMSSECAVSEPTH